MIEDIAKETAQLFTQYSQKNIERIARLPQSGSDRIYYRVYDADGGTCIATCNVNTRENETFLYFSKHFKNAGLPVPEIYGINNTLDVYLQQDLGETSLLNLLELHGHNDYTYNLFKQSLTELAKVQILGDRNLDYSQCLTAKAFGRQAIMSDLLYFKYYFLDTLKAPYDKQAMLNDFETLSNYLSTGDHQYFMFRDFQSRNVIVNQDKVHFIDYQGGMKGALQYDVASLLWQAKAGLSHNWKTRLLEDYIVAAEALLGEKIDRPSFISQYNGYVLIRLLQVLGAYGFRGLFERKAHFVASIPLALRNIAFFVANYTIDVDTPEFDRMLHLMVAQNVVSKFETVRAGTDSTLVVKVCSFSYKIALPKDETPNGGGFMFDCRSIHNPGRFQEYKHLTGRDKPVIDFLEQHTKMPEFLSNVYDLVDIAVDDYLTRGFNHLMISFGCTGGQHRSVYAADAVARHLQNKFGVKVEVSHMVQDAKNWQNTPEVIMQTVQPI